MNNNNWKEEFDKEFTIEEIGQKVSFLIKGFISNLLSQQRKELLESLLEEMKKHPNTYEDDEALVFRTTMKEVQDLIKSKLEI